MSLRPEQEPMLRCYGLSKEPFTDQGVRVGTSPVVTFGDVVHEVFRWLNELLYPDGNTYESVAVETSTGLYFSATEKDGGEQVYALDFDTNTPLSVVMPKSIASRHQVPYALFCLLAYHWYGEAQLRVMCANIEPAVWRRAFYLYKTILGVTPVDCRHASTTYGLMMYFEPEPSPDFVAPHYALLDGGIGLTGTEQVRQLLIVSSGLGLIEQEQTPEDRFDRTVYEIMGGHLRIVRDEVQAPPGVVPEPEPESVPLADPVDVLYHQQYDECRQVLLRGPRFLLLFSRAFGTGKSTIARQLATTLAVPYQRSYGVLDQHGLLLPEIEHCWVNGGLVHLSLDALHDVRNYLVLQDILDGVQVLSVMMPDRLERHAECYFVLESNNGMGRNYNSLKLALQLAPRTVTIGPDSRLQAALMPTTGETRLGMDVALLTDQISKLLLKNTDFDCALHFASSIRGLVVEGLTPKEAFATMLRHHPLIEAKERERLLGVVSELANTAAPKKLAPAKKSKATKAKDAEQASPDEQADALRNIVAPVIALPPPVAAPVAAPVTAEAVAEVAAELDFAW